MISLAKTRELTIKDFDSTQGKVIFNDYVNNTVADFYDVAPKEKEVLISLTKQFKEVAEKTYKKEISISQYAKEVEKLNEKAGEYENIAVSMNNKNEFDVSLKADLKKEYQTDVQLKTQKPMKKPAIFSLYAIEWVERERGWGMRPDGFSLHRSPEEATEFIKDFWSRQPKETPDEYTSPCSEKAKLIQVSESLHDYVVENGSVWLHPKNEQAYKTFDASTLQKPKKKM